MASSIALSAARLRALEHLARAVGAEGAVPTTLCRAEEAGEGIADPTVFATALALPLLGVDGDPQARALIERGTRYLARERGPGGLVRFWPRGHPRRAGIPPDLDDTAAVAALLSPRRRRLERLLLARRARTGPLPTWIVPRRAAEILRFPELLPALAFRSARHPFWRATEASPGDVDAGANAQALAWLGDRPETEAISAWLVELVGRGEEERADRWHRAWGVRWLVARAWRAGARSLAPAAKALATRVESEVEALARSGEAADLAYALATGAATGAADGARSALAAALVARQAPDGSFPRAALWYGGARRTVDWGSRAATTALTAGALALELSRRSALEPELS